MVGRILLGIGVALLLSGCLGGGDGGAGKEPYVTPGKGGTKWAVWQPIVSQSHGCGFCAGANALAPEVSWIGVDASGRVLVIEWALGAEPGVRLMDPALEPWNETAAEVLGAGDEYAQHLDDDGERVFSVRALQLDPADWDRVRLVLDDAMARLQPLGPPVYDCADCGAPVLKAAGMRVELMGNVPDGSGWPLLSQQLHALEGWAGGEEGS